ncbi:hypothetical protein J3458_003598 [Metarhizium acridum]|uniref:uncharacterized protein n=1 Tax=Metarhizium acridum TaxID=92637 RepID=UPI001C6AF853|nr:hypothetical protein J3458_003598 [Metarhizium acridum]
MFDFPFFFFKERGGGVLQYIYMCVCVCVLHCDDGDGHAGGLQPARGMEAGQSGEAILVARGHGVGPSLAKGRVDVAGAAAGAVLVHDGHVDEAADEAEVEDHGDEGGECEAGDAAEQQQADERVEGRGARDARHGADRRVDGEAVVVQRRQEVRVYAEDEGRAEELDAADEPLQELEGQARFCAHGGEPKGIADDESMVMAGGRLGGWYFWRRGREELTKLEWLVGIQRLMS